RRAAQDPDRPRPLNPRSPRVFHPGAAWPCYRRAGRREEPMRGNQDTEAHVLEIVRAAEGEASRRDADVLASWRRCMNEHQLDPSRRLSPRLVTEGELRQHRQESEDLLGMARHGMEDLYRRVNAMGYVLLLSNARGVTVDAIGDAQLDRELRHAGLISGSDWDERHVGTN